MRKTIKIVAPAAALSLAVFLQGCTQEDAVETPARNIVQLAEDLYRIQDDTHFTIALVTPEGIILGDPLNADR